MEAYKNLSRNSGISDYETGPDFIRIRFEDGSIYLYTDAMTGRDKVMRMKILAAAGEGLCTFINKNVREAYTVRER